MVLGGSCSADGIYATECWPRKLYKKLYNLGIPVCIYNGAHAGDTVVRELIRLLRDGEAIRPDIVITMDGLNDLPTTKYVNQNRFNYQLVLAGDMLTEEEICLGIPIVESPYHYWLRMLKNIKMYANSLGATSYSFLQPVNTYMPDMSMEEKMLYELEYRSEYSRLFYEKANSDGVYINLFSFFHHQNEMFFDRAHFTEKGADRLADAVVDAIKGEVISLCR